jgi:tetratricopeptide (TPR) repeat protein
MLQARNFLLLIFIAIIAGGCRQNTAAPPAASSSRQNNAQILEQARERLTSAMGGKRTGGNPDQPKSLDQLVKSNQEEVKANPHNVTALNQLAYTYIRKVRQTVDFQYNVLAEKLLRQALSLDPKNYDSLLYLSMTYMAQHRFEDARTSALKAIEVNDYGSGAYGILGDANYELGRYSECAEAYDKMGDLRPGAPFYTRVAWYRNLTGDSKSAIEFMGQALDAADARDPEDYSWYFLQLGNFAFDSGKTNDAQAYFERSLEIYPASYNALAGLAKVKVAQDKPQEAIALYEKALAIVPMPEFAAALGDVYASIGRTKDAEKQYELVEYIGYLSKLNQEIYNRQLALFYADHDRKLEEALQLVQNEIAIRKDIYGYDALAWCLYKNGRIQEAVKASQQALRMGTKDSKLLFHAGAIYVAAGKMTEAKKFLKQAVAIQPNFHPRFTKRVMELLGQIEQASGSLTDSSRQTIRRSIAKGL